MYNSINSTSFIRYKLAGRRESTLTMEDRLTGVGSDFTPHIMIGKTKKSIVRKFTNASGEALVVKSPNYSLNRSSFLSNEDFLKGEELELTYVQTELSFARRAYPDEYPYHLEANTYIYRNGEQKWTYRYIMPLIRGKVLGEFIHSITDDYGLLSLIFALTQEIIRIHHLGIIHGDIYWNNVICAVNENSGAYLVHYIDFETAYDITANTARFTNDYSAIRWAPERRCEDGQEPKPDFKQDVYSFGYMLTQVLNMTDAFSCQNGQFARKFPELFALIENSQKTDPADRPTFSDIAAVIENRIGCDVSDVEMANSPFGLGCRR